MLRTTTQGLLNFSVLQWQAAPADCRQHVQMVHKVYSSAEHALLPCQLPYA